MKLVKISIYMIIFLVFITACGGGGSGGEIANCDNALTVNYVNNKFASEPLFDNYTVSGTTLIHADGNQGNSFDIDSIILSRTSYSSDTVNGNSLALSYSVFTTLTPTSNTYIAFYMDVDNDANTGEAVGGIGAEVLILDGLGASETQSNAYGYIENSWVAAPKLGTLASTASYFKGCTLGVAVIAPLYEGLDLLYGANLTGVMQLISLNNSDPNMRAEQFDTTSNFSFTVP